MANCTLKLILALCLCQLFLTPYNAQAITVNNDGRSLLQQASQAYASDLRNQLLVLDHNTKNYVENIVRKLIPPHKQPPAPGNIRVTIIESPKPRLYSYIDGNIIITTAALFGMDNEAQLAGILAPEVAQLTEGYYLNMYQQIKAAKRNQQLKSTAGAIFGIILDNAVDYTIERENIRMTENFSPTEDTYQDTMKKMAALDAGQRTYHSIKDVISSIPATSASGERVDPRLQFEPIADAQGMEYLALAGYDPAEAAKGWYNIVKINNALAAKQQFAMGGMMQQLHDIQSLMAINMQRLNQSLDSSGLIQTFADIPPSRAQFTQKLIRLKEVKAATQGRQPITGQASYQKFILNALLPKANAALQNEDYDQAHNLYQSLNARKIQSPAISYGLAKSMLGDFAFGATNAEKNKAEKLYRQALRLAPNYAIAYQGLGDLYQDWERYGEAIKAYRSYLKKSNNPSDAAKINRTINKLIKKANR